MQIYLNMYIHIHIIHTIFKKVCLCLHTQHVCYHPQKPEEGAGPPGALVTGTESCLM